MHEGATCHTCGADAVCAGEPDHLAVRLYGMPLAEVREAIKFWARAKAEATGPAADPEPESVLLEAERIINGPRRAAYGGALESFTRIGRLWEPVLGVEASAEQVALCLIQLKVSRAVAGHDSGSGVQRDSVVDIAGYAGCLDTIARERGGWRA